MILSTSPFEENKTKQTGAYISESRGWRVTTINETQVRKLRGIDSRTNMLEEAETNCLLDFCLQINWLSEKLNLDNFQFNI